MPKIQDVQDITGKKLEIYRKVLVQEFIREFNFLADVVAGRANAKGDFTDKISKVITFSLTTVIDNVGVPLSGIINTAIETGIDFANEQRKGKKHESIGKLYDMVDQEELRKLMEQVAIKAAIRYEFFIAAKLSDNPIEGVIPFAKAGVERMLEYIARNALDLTEKNLLQGLIEGRSGAYISGYSNTGLVGKDESEQDLTAEGAYGRSAFHNQENDSYWALTKKEAKHKKDKLLKEEEIEQRLEKFKNSLEKGTDKGKKFGVLLEGAKFVKNITKDQITKLTESTHDYGYTKFTKPNDPKYGYADVQQNVIDQYGYQLHKPSANLLEKLKQFPARSKIVHRKDVEEYLKQLRDNNSKTKIDNFNNFLTEKYGTLAIAVCNDDLSKLNLDGADFSECDFSDAKLSECSMVGTKFHDANLYQAKLNKVKANKAQFNGAHLEYVIAKDADFSRADLTQSHWHFADLENAKLENIASLGALWTGANLSGVKSAPAAKERSKKHSEKIESKSDQINPLKELVENLDGQLNALSQKCATQSGAIEEIVANLAKEQQVHEIFERYCQTELDELWQQVETFHASEVKAKMTSIEQQLSHLHKGQEAIPDLVMQVNTLIEEMRTSKLTQKDLKQLTAKSSQLETNFAEFSQAQIEQLNQLEVTVWRGIAEVRSEVEIHAAKLAAHDEKLGEHDARIKELETKKLHAATPFWQPPKGATIKNSKATGLQLTISGVLKPGEQEGTAAIDGCESQDQVSIVVSEGTDISQLMESVMRTPKKGH